MNSPFFDVVTSLDHPPPPPLILIGFGVHTADGG